MTVNPEQSVIDEIDALVDEQMAGGEVTMSSAVWPHKYDRCSLCDGAWHGDPWRGEVRTLGQYDQHQHGRAVGCPGAYATGPQRIRFRHQREKRQRGYTIGDIESIRFVHGGYAAEPGSLEISTMPSWLTTLIDQTIAWASEVLGVNVVNLANLDDRSTESPLARLSRVLQRAIECIETLTEPRLPEPITVRLWHPQDGPDAPFTLTAAIPPEGFEPIGRIGEFGVISDGVIESPLLPIMRPRNEIQRWFRHEGWISQ